MLYRQLTALLCCTAICSLLFPLSYSLCIPAQPEDASGDLEGEEVTIEGFGKVEPGPGGEEEAIIDVDMTAMEGDGDGDAVVEVGQLTGEERENGGGTRVRRQLGQELEADNGDEGEEGNNGREMHNETVGELLMENYKRKKLNDVNNKHFMLFFLFPQIYRLKLPICLLKWIS